MKTYILVLKGKNKDIATFEFETLWEVYFNEAVVLNQIQNKIYTFTSTKNLIISKDFLNRLTYTNFIGLQLGVMGSFEEFQRDIDNLIDLGKLKGNSFAIRSRKSNKSDGLIFESKDYAKVIWDRVDNLRVDLENPNFRFDFFHVKSKIFVTEKIYENDKDYLRRMPKLRPVVKPYTLKSDISRASVNFLGLKEGLIYDPFCGTGAILLEAKDMDFKILGNDISWNDLRDMKDNFFYFFPGVELYRVLSDSRDPSLLSNSVDGIVTDIPYGRASRKLGIDLYEEFLKNAKRILKKDGKMVVIYANFLEFRKLALKYFGEVREVNEYINRSMTRKILILENNKDL